MRITAPRTMLTPLLLAALALPACGGLGVVDVRVYGEEFIEEGIPADAFVDGWSVTFDAFLVVVGDVSIDGAPLPGWHIVDLAPASGGEGRSLGEIQRDAGRLSALSYRIAANTSATATLADPQLAELARGHAVYVRGAATKAGVTYTFAWAFDTDTRYDPCELGRELPAGGSDSAELTIHADHLFYDDLESSEPNVAFDLIASADADADLVITEAELRAVDISGQARYQVGSRDISDLWSFIAAQVATLGHVDGEGHCETPA